MARQTQPKQPDTASPENRALVNPQAATPGDMMQFIQHQQSHQTQHDIGVLKAEIANLKTGQTDANAQLVQLGKDASSLAGMLKVASAALIIIGAVIWFFAGDKISTLLKMAEEQQLSEDQVKARAGATQPPNADDAKSK